MLKTILNVRLQLDMFLEPDPHWGLYAEVNLSRLRRMWNLYSGAPTQ